MLSLGSFFFLVPDPLGDKTNEPIGCKKFIAPQVNNKTLVGVFLISMETCLLKTLSVGAFFPLSLRIRYMSKAFFCIFILFCPFDFLFFVSWSFCLLSFLPFFSFCLTKYMYTYSAVWFPNTFQASPLRPHPSNRWRVFGGISIGRKHGNYLHHDHFTVHQMVFLEGYRHKTWK